MVFLECYKRIYVTRQLELFNLEKIKDVDIEDEKLTKIKNIINTIVQTPEIINISKKKENTDRKKVNELFYYFALFFNINYQTDKIEEMFNNKDIQDMLY